MSLLVTENLTKAYGQFRALSRLSMSVAPGEIVGLLGPNGSGKTTALRTILGFLRPTEGRATVAGFDSWRQSVEVRRRIAYLPGELRLYENMSGRQIVQFLGKLRGELPGPEVDALARRLDIDIDLPLTQLSSGMKRKIALLTVLVPRVPLIILDEPTNTLDPTMRDELLEQLQSARRAGKAVLFSSHVLHEVETICDRVLILRKGELVHEEVIANLQEVRLVTSRLTGPVNGSCGDGLMKVSGNRLTLEYRGPLPDLLAWLARQPIEELRIEPAGLGPIYRKYHGSN